MTSEFEIIRRHFQRPAKRPDVVLGSGDDAALLQPPPGMLLAVTTDTLIAGRHFHEYWPAADIGWRALAVNLSDLAAMGAQPAWFTCALTIPDVDETWLAGLAQGLFELAAQHHVDLVGGNLSRGPLSITVQALGLVKPGRALRRDGAQPGDLVCVTGTLGDAALSLLLEQSAASDSKVVSDFLSQRLRRPTPRVTAGLTLAGVAHAAIDISDGLAADLGHILEASGVGAEIRTDQLPMSPEFARLTPPDSRLSLQLSGGDDYELCFSFARDKLAAVQNELDVPLTVIGAVTEARGLRDSSASGRQLLTPAGYDHFL